MQASKHGGDAHSALARSLVLSVSVSAATGRCYCLRLLLPPTPQLLLMVVVHVANNDAHKLLKLSARVLRPHCSARRTTINAAALQRPTPHQIGMNRTDDKIA